MEMIEELKEYSIKDWALLILVVLIVVGLGLFAVNQFYEYRYKTYTLKYPCQLCEEINPHIVCDRGIRLELDNDAPSLIKP